jgi:tripartite-type tricarboxylate transporter receptor subunit TctC
VQCAAWLLPGNVPLLSIERPRAHCAATLGGTMKLPRRRFLHLAASAVAFPAISRAARAQVYPARPVRIIVGFPPGIAPDIIARLVGQQLSERFGQAFVIENRPGAGSNIGTEVVVKAPPDGYSLLWIAAANTINATLYPNLNFNFIRDIAPVAAVGRTLFVMVVNPLVPAKSVPEFISYAKANPGKINMVSQGNGTAPHVFGELFKMMAGVDLVHVPYRGDFMADLLGGRVQVAFNPIAQSLEYIRTGKLRALAMTGAKLAEALPGIPTVAEFLPGYEASGWQGIGAPKNTTAEIISALNNEIGAVVADPQVKARFVDIGVEPMSMTPVEFGKFIAEETEKWAKVVKFADIKPE